MRKRVWMAMIIGATIASIPAQGDTMPTIYDIPVTRITGEETTLREYAGSVLLIVNTASKCGFTGQYAGLQRLHETYGDRGLVVLGFPSNDFGKQEPGSNETIQEFCTVNYGVTFPLFAKIVVKQGESQHALYRYLTEEQTNPGHAGRIQWNFNKFLVDRDGKNIDRFGSRDKPEDRKVITAIEAALASESSTAGH